MFSHNTLLILGAGSSLNYGYPTGAELVKKIIDNIETDEVFFPLKQTEPPCNFNLSMFAENNKFCPKISDIPENQRINNHQINASLKREMIQLDNKGYFFLKIKLNEIKELNELKEAINQYSPVSIDIFLRDNPSHEKAGKLMIVYTLLKLENINDFNVSFWGKSEKNKYDDHWYPYLLNDILYGCADNPANIFDPKLKIITFNYDMSLDYYLYNTLSNIEILKNTYPDLSYLEQYRIEHVYGSLYKNIEFEYGKYNFEKKTANKNISSTKRFAKAFELKDNIETMRDSTSHMPHLKSLITDAKEIIIIGFGFDRTNLNILGFPTSVHSNPSYQSFLEGKIIRYLNYNGEMTNIDTEFETIANFSLSAIRLKPVKIIKSHATKIKNAYFRDFKPSLLLD
ncbi:hypothetical protein [Legionella cincinnatiensis]|uniref:SIR2-like domain-containing protein n=1 Tax=Legionella cincinnatiensis TaxID=28085 RepID=A0A378IKY1_9GAMM|nr:hypothetical protein [Legionella cincinnatiensis]KTC88583.1 hypothetical protein Lcin_1460 [Legionella cincinnatiensis]STX35928.1 Uncharacterised protein [Legionella cincinnatiensis]